MTGSPRGQPVAVMGQEIRSDGSTAQTVGIPVSELDRHAMIVGETGTGKSTTVVRALTSAHRATDGCTIAIDPKGDWASDIARAHYAENGTLADVHYFAVAEALPAFSYFDVRRDIAAGRDRGQAVKAVVDHFLELIEILMPGQQRAVRSPDVIEYLTIALFDPIDGRDAFPVSRLLDAITALRDDGTVPSVSTDWSKRLLESLAGPSSGQLSQIANGATTRVEKVYGDAHIRQMFEHVPGDADDAFSFDDWLEEDALILFDLGAIAARGQTVLAHVILSFVWRALKRRHTTTATAGESSQVLLAIDELAELNIERRLAQLLRLGRGYGLGVISLLQYPSQIRGRNTDAFEELVNNSHSILSGRVSNDAGLAAALRHGDWSQAELQRTLASLPLDRWLFQPATPRGAGTVPAHRIADPELPEGHPSAGPGRSFDPDTEQTFQTVLANCQQRTADTHGVEYDEYTKTGVTPTRSLGEGFPDDVETALRNTSFSTTLPLIETLPGPAQYQPTANAIKCTTCGRIRDATVDGLLDTLRCHASLENYDVTDIPPVALNLPLSDGEIAAHALTLSDLCILQLVHNITADRYTLHEYDPVFDDPKATLEHLSIDIDRVDALVEDGYLRKKTLHKRGYYSLTQDGRNALHTEQRKGVDYGTDQGDLTESTLHQGMVTALDRYITNSYVDDPTSPVTTTTTYYQPGQETRDKHDLSAGTRFDVVGLDDTDTIHVIGEAECQNNDYATAAINDYDKIAAITPSDALWLVPSQTRGHTAVLQPLSDPSPTDSLDDHTPRISSYSDTTRITQITGIDNPGMTFIQTLDGLRTELTPPELPRTTQ